MLFDKTTIVNEVQPTLCFDVNETTKAIGLFAVAWVAPL